MPGATWRRVERAEVRESTARVASSLDASGSTATRITDQLPVQRTSAVASCTHGNRSACSA